jgi:hypothetical protein
MLRYNVKKRIALRLRCLIGKATLLENFQHLRSTSKQAELKLRMQSSQQFHNTIKECEKGECMVPVNATALNN